MLDHDNLEEFADALSYDNQDSSDTGLAFYAGLAAETGAPVLEIACGTGRILIPIARQGFKVVGVDIVPGMIELARRKSTDLPARWFVGDARTFDIGEQFRLAFLTGNAFQMFLTRADQEALFERVHAHLHDDGLFAFETRNPRWANGAPRKAAEQGAFADLETRAEPEIGEPYTDCTGREVHVTRTQTYDHAAQILEWTSLHRWLDGGREHTKTTRIALRYTFPQELEALLYYNGFELLRQYGDWDLEPLSASSPSIIVVCRKRGSS